MNVLSLFTGAGGFDLGLERAGWRTVFQCEIEPNCAQVLRHNWPNVPRWDDVTTLTGEHVLRTAGHVDVVAWGSPCQDLSSAGRRAGLSGERSGLFHEGIRIIKELRELTSGREPVWSIWENVAGALSSNRGADFGQVLYELDVAGASFSEWAVLDAQHFGVPQRRRRVFVVSCFDPRVAERCSEPLLPVAESGAWDHSTSGSPKENPARTTEARPRANDRRQDDARTLGSTAAPLLANDGDKWGGNQWVDDNKMVIETGLTREPLSVAGPITAGISKGPRGTEAIDSNWLVLPREQDSQPFTRVRRFTPIECERLMGWPDGHTARRADGRVNSDTARYRMCGNGVVAPVATWIAEQINK